MSEAGDDGFLLIPTPRRATLLGGSVPIPALNALHWRAPIGFDVNAALGCIARGQRRGVDQPAWLECRFDHQRPRDAKSTGGQSYLLKIAPGREREPSVVISAGTVDGLRHGVATLGQVLTTAAARGERELPCLAISDEPAFAVRGVMLDVSRDRVPRMDELRRVVEQLAALKINHVQLYTEHTFAYAGHEEVWRDWSPMTPAEVRALDEHCKRFGITLAANQNCFGHLSPWLKLPRYAPLAEIQGADTLWRFYEFERRGPFSVCPDDPGSIALIEDLLGQLLPCFSSGLVNINCDETFDVGQGRSRDRVAREGAAAVYMEFLGKVASACRRQGFSPMFWADIALHHPDQIARIPEGLLALAWGYEPGARFAEWCELLRGAGRSVWVCPGTSSWRSITGRTSERRGNLAAAVEQGTQHGAEGVLTCDWGDVGHRQQWPISLHGIARAAEAMWTGAGGVSAENLAAESLHVFGDRGLRVAAWLEELGDADLMLRNIAGRPDAEGKPTKLHNATAIFAFGLSNDRPPGTVGAWDDATRRLSEIAARKPAAVAGLFDAELAHALDVAAFAAERGRARCGGEMLRAGRERLGAIIAEHRRLWLERSRPGGLDHSCSYYEPLGLA